MLSLINHRYPNIKLPTFIKQKKTFKLFHGIGNKKGEQFFMALAIKNFKGKNYKFLKILRKYDLSNVIILRNESFSRPSLIKFHDSCSKIIVRDEM